MSRKEQVAFQVSDGEPKTWNHTLNDTLFAAAAAANDGAGVVTAKGNSWICSKASSPAC